MTKILVTGATGFIGHHVVQWLADRGYTVIATGTSEEKAKQVYDIAKKHEKILVCLDSNHTHDHVLKELKLYAPLVSVGSYCVVFDTVVEDLPDDMFPDRPWGHGNNPKTAVHEYLKNHPEFIIDKNIEQKLLVTVAPSGYLKRIE